MHIIDASYRILTPISENGLDELKHIESIARVCYKSESLITEDGTSANTLITKLLKLGHEAMIEHGPSLSVEFTVDRGVSHEIVRHRIASYAQESTRYCDYSQDKFDGQLTFIRPCFWESGRPEMLLWEHAMEQAETNYIRFRELKAQPQEARSLLPNSLKTTITMTANYREWRNFFKLRTDIAAHPQMREVAIPLLDELKQRIPVMFDDIKVTEEARQKGFCVTKQTQLAEKE